MIVNDREKTAIMLAIFAIEELGKALITVWGNKNKASKRPYPTHVEKQSATFALLAAYEACSMPKRRLARRLNKAPKSFHNIGPFSSQFAYARSVFFDDFRMAVTYADEFPKLKIQEKEVDGSLDMASELLGWFALAGRAMANVPAMQLASEIYENDLGRL